jgi:lysophospholipase L1-like esterase
VTGSAEPLPSPAPYSANLPGAVFFVGDSITLGWRDEGLGGWPVRVIGALPRRNMVTAYNLGIRGDTSEGVKARWRDEVARRRQANVTAALVFAFGANDAKLHPDGTPLVPLEATRRNIAAILEAATRDHRVLFVGPAPVDEEALAHALNPDGNASIPSNHQIGLVSDVIREEAERFGVAYFDLFRLLSDEADWFDGLRETDGIHPPGRGHDIIAAMIGRWEAWSALFQDGAKTR